MENIKELNDEFITIKKKNNFLKIEIEQLQEKYNKIKENHQHFKNKLKYRYLYQENSIQEKEWLKEKIEWTKKENSFLKEKKSYLENKTNLKKEQTEEFENILLKHKSEELW